jgi:hypothetical protein
MDNEKIHIKVERPRHVFLTYFLIACLTCLIGFLLVLFSISFDFKIFPWVVAVINFIVIAFVLPIFIYFTGHNYHILELIADDENLQIKYLDKRVEKQTTIPLKELVMVLGGTGTRSFKSALYIFKGEKKVMAQIQGNGWSKQMLRDVYNQLWKYNPKNTPPA